MSSVVKIIYMIIVTDLEISSALQRSSVSAQQAGVSFEELASMITVVSDVSRRAPESIGEAFKTIFSRYQDILAGGVDDEGQGINNVGKALERVGINIRDAEGGFRDFSDVLDDLYPKWESLNEIEQSNILKALAGTRQRESLLILLENQTKYEKGLEVQLGSTGKALERYDEYLNGVEASQNKFNASWEKLAQEALSSGAISGFYKLSAGVLDFMSALGGIPAILGVIVTSLIAFNGVALLTSMGIFGIADAWAALSLAMSANPFGFVVLGIGAAVLAFNYFHKTASETLEDLNADIQKHNDEISRLRNNAKSISELSSKYEELNKIYKDTGVMSQEFLDVQNQLKELIPELSGKFDEYGNFILDADTDMKNLNASTLEQIRLEKELRQAKIDEKAGTQAEDLLDIQMSKKLADANVAGSQWMSDSEKLQIQIDWSKALQEAKTAFAEMSDEGRQAFIEELQARGGSDLAEVFVQQINSELANQEVELFGTPEIIEEKAKEDATVAYESFRATIDGLIANSESISDLIQKSMEEGLSLSDVAKVPEEYLSALTTEGDKIKLNISLIKEKQLADAEMAYQAVLNAQMRGDASANEVNILRVNYNQLLAESEATYGQFGQTAWAYDELLWKLANDAYNSGIAIYDLEGQALTSAQSIYEFMASGDGAFNAFVQQAAEITGQTVEQITSQINSMLQTSANNAAALINYLGASSLGVDSGFNRAPSAPPQMSSGGGSLFGGVPRGSSAPSFSGGGGGGSSAKDERESKEAERLKEIEKEIEDARNDATKSLKNQLKIYKQMVDERKKLLDTIKEERSYQQDLEEKQGNVADIQNQIAELSLDDSAEAQAQVLALQEQLADAQQELGNLEFEHGIDQQQTALDDELSRVENLVENAIMAIEGIDASSLASFTSQLSTILAGLGSAVPQFHTGVNAGFVGGRSESKENEQFAKLLKGELVISPEQMSNFMNKTLPSIMSGTPSVSSTMQGMEIGQLMNFNISGNLDRNVLPSIEKIANMVVDKLNDNMLIRGTKRGAGLFSA